ncbi:MAG: crossover junction endodeoxyribonuclease RuvC [Deltaproteobacteria bacterium]|nr:crossover junction endodeoxyribonuclease RuvC [Deltaproteobacteria bacterium]
MKVIGIDPGLANTGVAILCGNENQTSDYAFGTIRTSKDKTLASRLHHIYCEIQKIIKRERPDLMVIEDIFSLEKYPTAGIVLGKVCGVLLLSGQLNGIPTIEIAAREAKQVLTGNGNAGKSQVEKAVRHLLNRPTPIRPSHAADALSLAFIGLYRYSHEKRIKNQLNG